MGTIWKTTVAPQFGAALDMVERAITACPDALWADRARPPAFGDLVHHTLFWLDLYLSDEPEAFVPPPPFGLEELDPAGVLPERVYTRDELLAHLAHGRRKLAAVMDAMTDERARHRYRFGSVDLSVGELQLYDLRHVQHHAGQLQLLLRQAGVEPPRWAFRAADAGDVAAPRRAEGPFEVDLKPQATAHGDAVALLGRRSIDKRFHGDLEGASRGEMLSAGTAVRGSAGYVAIEQVEGALHGRRGTFTLQHSATLDRGAPRLSVTVVPDSGTGELAGLAGAMEIVIEDGRHRYVFDYALPGAS